MVCMLFIYEQLLRLTYAAGRSTWVDCAGASNCRGGDTIHSPPHYPPKRSAGLTSLSLCSPKPASGMSLSRQIPNALIDPPRSRREVLKHFLEDSLETPESSCRSVRQRFTCRASP